MRDKILECTLNPETRRRRQEINVKKQKEAESAISELKEILAGFRLNPNRFVHWGSTRQGYSRESSDIDIKYGCENACQDVNYTDIENTLKENGFNPVPSFRPPSEPFYDPNHPSHPCQVFWRFKRPATKSSSMIDVTFHLCQPASLKDTMSAQDRSVNDRTPEILKDIIFCSNTNLPRKQSRLFMAKRDRLGNWKNRINEISPNLNDMTKNYIFKN